MGRFPPKGLRIFTWAREGSEGMWLQGVTFRKEDIFTEEDEVIAWAKGWRGYKCILVFPSGSPPTFTAWNLWNLHNSPNLSWHLDMALKVGKASSSYSQHTSPVKKGRDAMRNRLKRWSILEKLWCQLSVFPRDPLKASSFGVMGVEGKQPNTSRITFSDSACNVTLMIADVSTSGDEPKSPSDPKDHLS